MATGMEDNRIQPQRQLRKQQQARREENPLLLFALSFILTTVTGLLLVAFVWFITWWPVRSQIAAWAEPILPPAVVAAIAPEMDRLAALQADDSPSLASAPAVVENQSGQPAQETPGDFAQAAAVDSASPLEGQPVTHVPLPESAAGEWGVEAIPILPEAPPPPQEPQFPDGELIIEPLAVAQVPQKVAVREGSWDLSELHDRVGWLETTGTHPEDELAMVFIGHITMPYPGGPGPFLKLEQLRPGDIVLYQTAEETFIYQVEQTSVISPFEVQSLYRSDGERLLLVTCTTYNYLQRDYENRLLVEASLIIRESRTSPGG